MGVYDHMARPSMGHKMQVELRDSMERYHSDKEYLQTHLAQLRFGSHQLHTSPPPRSPEMGMKKWGEPGSRFNQAPERAAHKARLAQLQQQSDGHNKGLSSQHTSTVSSSTILPPINHKMHTEDKPKTEDTVKTGDKPKTEDTVKTGDKLKSKTATAGTEESQSQANRPAGSQAPAGKAGGVKGVPKASTVKGRKFLKKGGLKKMAVTRDRMLPILTLPPIPSATPRRSMWDSGRQHLLVQGPSTHLEKNHVDEDCRNFTNPSLTIPLIVDAKRTEIQRPLGARPTPTASSTKVQFRRPPPHRSLQQGDSTVTEVPQDPKTSVDHFPPSAPCLPDLDDTSTDDGQSEDGTEDQGQGQSILLPPVPQPATLPVPPLHLHPGLADSALSSATARSGATGATYMSLMSQETQEWKGAYMQSDNPHHKSRMLMEILHATRQRMQDNEEDLRLAGDLPRPSDMWGREGRSDALLLHRDGAIASEAITARSSEHKPIKLPQQLKKRGAGRPESQSTKLHRYLNNLSHRRTKAGNQQPPQHRHAPFHLATMTIREITQSSLEPQSALQTAS